MAESMSKEERPSQDDYIYPAYFISTAQLIYQLLY